MNDISCNVCMDLMPLVKDGIASEDSRALVLAHLAGCKHCAAAFGAKLKPEAAMDETAVLHRIKRRLTLFLFGAIFAGALIGMALSDGMGMFYNVLIMPAIGGFGYVLLRKKSYLAPLGLFAFSFVWVSIREISRGFLSYSTAMDLIVMSIWWSVLFAGLCAVGVVIAALLHVAFQKER